ncbi:MAG: hypothetical protein ACM3UZ_11440 [Acidobacteriota bacterium]
MGSFGLSFGVLIITVVNSLLWLFLGVFFFLSHRETRRKELKTLFIASLSLTAAQIMMSYLAYSSTQGLSPFFVANNYHMRLIPAAMLLVAGLALLRRYLRSGEVD